MNETLHFFSFTLIYTHFNMPKIRKKLNSYLICYIILNKDNITNEFTFIAETITRFDK